MKQPLFLTALEAGESKVKVPEMGICDRPRLLLGLSPGAEGTQEVSSLVSHLTWAPIR